MKKIVFFFYLFLLLAPMVRAQQDSTSVNYDTTSLKVKHIRSADLQKFTEDEDFNYEVAKTEDNWWNNFKTWLANTFLRFFEWLFGVEKATGFLALFFRLIPYILLGILLYILIKFFIGANARSLLQAQKSKGAVSLSEEERIIKNEDITQLIKEALKVGDYRLAVRFYYLYILQLMTEKELIVWQLQKTNDDYIEELIKAKLQGPFKDLTYLYDYIWYGNFPIDQASFLTAEKKFLSLKKNIEAHG